MRAPSTTSRSFPELEQIEAIVQEQHAGFLQSQILCQVPCRDDLLPVYALTLGNPDPGVPSVTYVAGIHGLERIGTQVVIAYLEGLLERLNWDRIFADILQRVRINFLPIVNPAGMLNNTRANSQGVDLMRNAPVDSYEKTILLAGGHRISPALPWYRGRSNEPMQLEAQALCDFISQ